MVFNSVVVATIFLLWLGILTAWLVYKEITLRRFFKNAKTTDIRRLLEEVLKQIDQSQKITDRFNQILLSVQREDLQHLQKVGLVRFNPFRDAGGNQSFTMALLNDENSGIVLTGLHARETTRMYVKEINKGTSKNELSKEEKQAVDMAMKE